MSWFPTAELHEPRKMVFASCRGLSPVRSRALLYLLEDLACALDDATLLVPEGSGFPSELQAKSARFFFRNGSSRLARSFTPSLPLNGSPHELLFIGCQGVGDLSTLLPLFTRDGIAKRKTCFMEELWVKDLELRPLALACLRTCDFLLVGCSETVAPLEKLTGVPCFHLPPSVDTLRFTPFGLDGKTEIRPRTIDLYWMGRRETELHTAFHQWSRDSGRFYLFDTAGNAPFQNHIEHREHLIDLIQRSRYFMVQEAKAGNHAVGHQHEIGFRFFEGAAAGTVMLGPPTDAANFKEFFPHDEVFITVDGSPADFVRTMQELDQQPERRAKIGRRNVAHMLRHHDHAHRILQVMKIAGLKPGDGLLERIEHLGSVAAATLDSI
ncbi:MAG: hypothetical protein COA70_10940 [Planctomycetota bacterium]|nr:MAG: hypothetical protein COA70_10940 [Planctomycetota bacterium]